MKDKKKSREIWKERLAENWVTNLVAILAVVIAIFSWMSSCESNITSYEANKLSCEANKISQEALKIAKTAELPYFKFSVDFSNDQDEILIYNEGGKLRELGNPEVYLFWRITSNKTLLNPKDIIVLNYYNLGSRDPLLPNKKPVTISAESTAKAENLINEFKKLANGNDSLSSVSVNRYIRLQYKDIYDEPHDDMYDVSSLQGKKMSKNEAAELIKKYDQMRAQGLIIDMHNISPEILYEKWQH